MKETPFVRVIVPGGSTFVNVIEGKRVIGVQAEMEDHYDKVLEHVASAHSTYSKALTELLSGIDRVVAVAEQKE